MSDTDGETAAFALCESAAEIYLLLYHQDGLEGVERLLDMSAETNTREGLRRDAAALQRVGLVELAAALKQRAKKTKPAPMNFKTRWSHRSFKK
jgi:hypothetical protein